MNVEDHPEEGRAVWLSYDDIELLLDQAKNTERRIAYGLGVRCGLRTEEITNVKMADVKETEMGPIVVVERGKGDKYRETPLPENLKTIIETYADAKGFGPADTPVSVTTTRAVRKWIERDRQILANETGDSRWLHVSMHDLRRTWANALRNEGVDAEMAIEWGGWEDLETFLEHYKGKFSPEAQREQRELVSWL
jgi:integrase